MSPRPCVAMKLIASGVANWAAIEVALVLAVGRVHDDHQLPLADVLDRLVDRGEGRRLHLHAHVSLGSYPAGPAARRAWRSRPPRGSPRRPRRARRASSPRACAGRARRRRSLRREPRASGSRPRPRSSPSPRSSAGSRARPRSPGPPRPPGTRPTPSTWPWTKWPPSGSPARSAGSTLTAAPASRRPSELRRSVSGTTSNSIAPSVSRTAVRQTPFTLTESPGPCARRPRARTAAARPRRPP